MAEFGVNEFGNAKFGDSDYVVNGEVIQSTAIAAAESVPGSDDTTVSGSVTAAATTKSEVTVSRDVSGAVTSSTAFGSDITVSRDVSASTISTGTIASSTVTEPTFYEEHPELVETVVHEGEVNQRDRLEEFLKAPFQSPRDANGDYQNNEFGLLVSVVAEFAQGYRYMMEELLRQQYINTAHHQGLDEIGYFVGIYRQTNEKDPSYRARIKAGYRGLLGGANVEQVIQITADLFNTSVDEIELREPFVSDSARIDLTIPQYVADAAPVSEEGFIELVLMYRAAGVEITLGIGERFTYRSLADYHAGRNDPSQAYNRAPYRSQVSAED